MDSTDPAHMIITCGASPRTLSTQGKTVLLVSRAGHVREALIGLLKTLPTLSTIKTAESGLLALGMACEVRPHLVLIASGLPEAEGPELVRQFQQRWPGVHSLLLAENARQLEQARLAGANCALPARVPSEQLLRAVNLLISQ